MKYQKITTILVFSLMLFLALGTIVVKPVSFSENENRVLASFPKFSGKSVLDKTYMDGLSTYVSEHFIYRDAFMSLSAMFEKTLQKKEINHVYMAKDDYWIEKYEKPQNTENIIERWNTFTDKISIRPDLLLIPTSIVINQDKLPAYAEKANQLEVQEEIYSQVDMHGIHVEDTLLEHNKTQPMYYRTDHHWTSYGAYYAYEEYCREKNLKPVPLEHFRIEKISDDFYGTVFSKVNDITIPPDEIYAFYQEDWDLSVSYDGVESDSLYAPEYLEKKDKYSFFLDNLHEKIEITNANVKNQKTLIVVKDSYANCFIPFLVNHYEKIIVLDTRYYKFGVSSLVKSEEADEVLFLFNLNTLDTDLAIKGIY